MHPESPEAITRNLFAEWVPWFVVEGATPAACIGVSQTEPGRVIIMTPKSSTLADTRELLAHALREVERIEREQAAPRAEEWPRDTPDGSQ